MKKLFAIFYLVSLFACDQQQNHHRHVKHVSNQKVQCYRQHKTNEDGSQAFIFWYMIFTMNDGPCYYYTSNSPITNFTTVIWQESKDNPITNYDEAEFQQMSEVEVQANELSTEMQVEMDSSPENFGGMTESELGDYEGGTETNSTGNGSDNSSDGGSSDGGGSDGGGDGGGGDGGGGD